jgi:hypothetical protein
MAVPTREALMGETDLEFSKQYPGAPERLDPNDPGQAHLVQAWHELYTKQLKLTVDRIFFSFYPHAPDQLDPGDPSQAQLVEYWNDIQNLIEHGTSQWNWNADPTPADPIPDGGQIDASQFASFIHDVLTDAVQLATEGEVVTVLVDIDDAGRGPALPWLEAALGPPEALASELAEAPPDAHSSRPGLWLQEKEGFCYGLLWEVSGGYDFQKAFAGTPDDSAEHLGEAFYAGVAVGRHRGAWPSVRNRVLLLVGYRMAHGDLSSAGYEWLLNVMWHSLDNTSRDLSWPKPEDQHN